MAGDFSEDLRRAGLGDEEAWSRVLKPLQDRLLSLADQKLGPRLRGFMRPSDLLQTTFFEVLASLKDFQGKTEDEFVALFARALENNARDKARYFDAEKRVPPGPMRIGKPESCATTGSATPSAVAAGKEDLGLVHAAMNRLAEDHRNVIVLRAVEGREFDEIARLMGRSEDAVRMLLSRARAALAVEVDRLGDPDGPR